VKSLSDFYKHAETSDGHLNKCKDCTKADAALHRQANLERIRAYDRMRGAQPHRLAAQREYAKTPEGKAAHKRAIKASQIKNPKRRAAAVALNNAVRDGRVQKLPCEICGAAAEGHHPDYSRPLMVVWLCPSHHLEAHAVLKEAA
jgi:rubrerythrin